MLNIQRNIDILRKTINVIKSLSINHKTETFYNHNWADYSIDEFIPEIDSYIHRYCSDRNQSTLEGLSPLEYKRSIGVSI